MNFKNFLREPFLVAVNADVDSQGRVRWVWAFDCPQKVLLKLPMTKRNCWGIYTFYFGKGFSLRLLIAASHLYFHSFFSCSFLWGYSIQDLNCCNKIISSYAIFVFPLILNYSIVECFKGYYELSSGLGSLTSSFTVLKYLFESLSTYHSHL